MSSYREFLEHLESYIFIPMTKKKKHKINIGTKKEGKRRKKKRKVKYQDYILRDEKRDHFYLYL